MSLTPRINKLEKNLQINGHMLFAQRGTSIVGINDGQYFADRFVYKKTGTTAVVTGSQSTSAPTRAQAGYPIPNSIKVDVTTADASQDAADRATIRTTLEGYDFVQIHQGYARIQFWVFSTKTGTFGVSFRNSAADRAYVTSKTVNAINTWEKKVIDIQLDQAGTWLLDNGAGLVCDVVLMAGSNFQTSTLDAWQSSSTAFAPTTQTNFLDNTANDFYMTGFQIIPGQFSSTEDIPFFTAGSNYEQELHMCQRYFEKTTNPTVTADTITDVGAIFGSYSSSNPGICSLTHIFKANKRVNPSSSVYNPVTGVNNGIRVGASNEGASLVGNGMGSVGASAGGNFSAQTATAKAHFVSDADFG